MDTARGLKNDNPWDGTQNDILSVNELDIRTRTSRKYSAALGEWYILYITLSDRREIRAMSFS